MVQLLNMLNANMIGENKQTTYSKFKKENDIDKRKKDAMIVKQKYPERIPVIVEKDPNCIDLIEIDKCKFLVPNDLTMSQFMFVIRKRIKVPPEKAIFMFINNLIMKKAELLSNIYEEYKDEDGFLYVIYSSETTFGFSDSDQIISDSD